MTIVQNGISRQDRVRRVVILCASFARNLAYQRAMVPFRARLNQSDHEFWMTVSNNSLDVAVLEWCKLMADRNDKHHWSHVVTDAAAFEGSLLTAIGMTKDEFAGYETAMRRYRDKFIAHLDSDAEMDIPQLEQAERAVAFYHSHVVEQEAEGIDLHGLPATGAQMATYYHAEERSAAIRYDAAMQPVAG